MDFVRNRMFRQTLLVHAEVPISRSLNGSVMKGLHVSSSAQPASKALSLLQGVPEQFRGTHGANINTVNAITKAALALLAEEWPAGRVFEDLVREARVRVDAEVGKPASEQTLAKDPEMLGNDLLTCYTGALIELRAHTPRLTLVPSEKPVASSFARYRATSPTGMLVNLRHDPVNLDLFNRHLLALLDGTRDRNAIVASLAELVGKGVLQVQDKGETVKAGPDLDRILHEAVNENLPKLGRAALLLS
jgi:methyltransferase-like protein